VNEILLSRRADEASRQFEMPIREKIQQHLGESYNIEHAENWSCLMGPTLTCDLLGCVKFEVEGGG
jgi:hypothetical protein